jgi:diphosphomevalonate decarboxylase
MAAVVCKAGPSLALVKYWGKRSSRDNTAATTSIALTLKGLVTETRVSLADGQDRVVVGGREQDPARYAAFFDHLRSVAGVNHRFDATSTNSFPTGAGLASSSSGFAALAWACTRAAGLDLAAGHVSAIARVGSASAARAVFGGWVELPAGQRAARRLYGPEHWPEVRVVVVTVRAAAKEVSSRAAMELTRGTSPFYRAWVRDARRLAAHARAALARRDLEQLGDVMRASTYRMFATMLGSRPAVTYWQPGTLAVIHECARLRASGIGAWETMDAGPQVKIFCLAGDLEAITAAVRRLSSDWSIIVSEAGPDPVCAPA